MVQYYTVDGLAGLREFDVNDDQGVNWRRLFRNCAYSSLRRPVTAESIELMPGREDNRARPRNQRMGRGT